MTNKGNSSLKVKDFDIELEFKLHQFNRFWKYFLIKKFSSLLVFQICFLSSTFHNKKMENRIRNFPVCFTQTLGSPIGSQIWVKRSWQPSKSSTVSFNIVSVARTYFCSGERIFFNRVDFTFERKQWTWWIIHSGHASSSHLSMSNGLFNCFAT